jgi:tetratricopeptide (TPR) repeat protein
MDPDFLHEYLSLGISLGILLEDLQQYDEAEKEYREIIKIDPDFAEAHFNLAYLLADLQRYDEAEKEYIEVIRIYPDYVKAHYVLGVLLKKLQRYDEAKKEILKARKLSEEQGRIKDVESCDEILKDL